MDDIERDKERSTPKPNPVTIAFGSPIPADVGALFP
jgi:hypothetical protein